MNGYENQENLQTIEPRKKSKKRRITTLQGGYVMYPLLHTTRLDWTCGILASDQKHMDIYIYIVKINPDKSRYPLKSTSECYLDTRKFKLTWPRSTSRRFVVMQLVWNLPSGRMEENKPFEEQHYG